MRVHLRLILTYLSAALSFDPIPSLIIEGGDATSVYGTSPPSGFALSTYCVFHSITPSHARRARDHHQGSLLFWTLLAKLVLCYCLATLCMGYELLVTTPHLLLIQPDFHSSMLSLDFHLPPTSACLRLLHTILSARIPHIPFHPCHPRDLHISVPMTLPC